MNASIEIIFEKPAAGELYDPEREREHGPSGDLTRHFCDNVSVRCTVHEREEFELEHNVTFEADQLPPEQFSKFLNFLDDAYGPLQFASCVPKS